MLASLTTAVAAIIAVGTAAALAVRDPAPPGQGAVSDSSTQRESPLLDRLGRAMGRPVSPSEIVVSGAAGARVVVAAERAANAEERTYGGRAAGLWVSNHFGVFRQFSDYISYDLVCKQRDSECERLRPTGLGFLAVVTDASRAGTAYVMLRVPSGRTAEVLTAEGVRTRVEHASSGAVVKVSTDRPWDLTITVGTSQGRSYQLPLPPGGVVRVDDLG